MATKLQPATIPSNVTMFGHGAKICTAPASFQNTFSTVSGGGSGIEIHGLTSIGNLSTQPIASNASLAFATLSGSSNIYLHDNVVLNLVHAGFSLGGTQNALVANNYMNTVWRGEGISCRGSVAVQNCQVLGNRIYNTRWAGIGGDINGGIIAKSLIVNGGNGDTGTAQKGTFRIVLLNML
jgi:hypothetical protein